MSQRNSLNPNTTRDETNDDEVLNDLCPLKTWQWYDGARE
jgi:hypothetical protein